MTRDIDRAFFTKAIQFEEKLKVETLEWTSERELILEVKINVL